MGERCTQKMPPETTFAISCSRRGCYISHVPLQRLQVAEVKPGQPAGTEKDLLPALKISQPELTAQQ